MGEGLKFGPYFVHANVLLLIVFERIIYTTWGEQFLIVQTFCFTSISNLFILVKKRCRFLKLNFTLKLPKISKFELHGTLRHLGYTPAPFT